MTIAVRAVTETVEVNHILTAEDFWSFVDRSGDCWLWTGRVWKGRGLVHWKGRQITAHRLAWILENETTPIGQPNSVRQTCREPLCVRPVHLRLGNLIDHRTPNDFWKLLKRVPNVRLGSDCWIWTHGHVNAGISTVALKDGYGVFKYRGKQWLTHRLAWTLKHGEIPKSPITGKDKLILHHCDTPSCCNPDHLFIGTDAVNRRDMVAKGRAKYACGEQDSQAKLTDSLVREIRSKYTGKYGQISALAREYGVHVATMYSVVARKTWKHVI